MLPLTVVSWRPLGGNREHMPGDASSLSPRARAEELEYVHCPQQKWVE
jgi:hypothetical protein